MLGILWKTLTLCSRQRQYSTRTKIALAMFKSAEASLVREIYIVYLIAILTLF